MEYYLDVRTMIAYYPHIGADLHQPKPHGPMTLAHISASGETNTALLNKINNFETIITNIGLSKFNIIRLYKGGTSSFNNGLNFVNTNTFQGTFYNGVTMDSTGVQFNGINGYEDTGFNSVGNIADVNSMHYCLLSKTAEARGTSTSTSTFGHDMGVSNTSTYWAILSIRAHSNVGYMSFNSTNIGYPTYTDDARGVFLVQRESSNYVSQYKNGTVQGFSYTNSTGLVNRNVFVGAMNRNGSPLNYSNAKYAHMSIGSALTQTEVSIYTNAINDLNS